MILQVSILLFCVSSVWTQDSIAVDFAQGTTSGSIPNSQWILGPTASSSPNACDGQAILKINVPTGKAAEINMEMSHSNGYSFNIGDSPTNNAWGGDSSSTYFDAEIHSRFKSFLVYGRDQPTGGSYGLILNEPNVVHPTSSGNSYFKLLVSHERVHADNGENTIILVVSPYIYQLAGQDQNDLYIGLNRVVQSYSNRVGSGVCKADIAIVDL